MMEFLASLTESELANIAQALRAERIRPPFSAMSFQQVVSDKSAAAASAGFEALRATGVETASIILMIEAIIADRRGRTSIDDAIDLVTTGPEASGVTNRDTSVVVRELFANGRSTVLVVGFAVYQGQRVFAALADRMTQIEDLRVRLFLDVARDRTDTSLDSEVLRRFADRFVSTQWPAGHRLPQVFYYPPSVQLNADCRASLHAKCVVVDGTTAFVSSANFTEAAQERNIEVGVQIRSRQIAGRITRHFDALVDEGLVQPLPFPSDRSR